MIKVSAIVSFFSVIFLVSVISESVCCSRNLNSKFAANSWIGIFYDKHYIRKCFTTKKKKQSLENKFLLKLFWVFNFCLSTPLLFSVKVQCWIVLKYTSNVHPILKNFNASSCQNISHSIYFVKLHVLFMRTLNWKLFFLSFIWRQDVNAFLSVF